MLHYIDMFSHYKLSLYSLEKLCSWNICLNYLNIQPWTNTIIYMDVNKGILLFTSSLLWKMVVKGLNYTTADYDVHFEITSLGLFVISVQTMEGNITTGTQVSLIHFPRICGHSLFWLSPEENVVTWSHLILNDF